MRVLIVNTSEHTGGAAIAAARLREALGNNGIKATMLVSRKESEAITVAEPRDTGRMKYNFLRERFTIWKANGFRKHRLFEVDAANFGIDITGMKDFEEADIIHLHWINQGFLSLKGIAKILRSGKPWCGRFMTCGLSPAFVITTEIATAIKIVAANVPCFTAEALREIFRAECSCGNANSIPMPT